MKSSKPWSLQLLVLAKLEINFYHNKAGQLYSMVKFAIKQADKGHHEGNYKADVFDF